MNKNTQILTFELFQRICDSYERLLAFSKEEGLEKEDNLETFADFIKTKFNEYNIVWPDNNDFSNLYTVYLSYKDKIDVDFSNITETAESYFEFLKTVQAANFYMSHNEISFNDFVEQTTSAKNIDANTRKAIYSLIKFLKRKRELRPEEKDTIMKAIVDKKNNITLRKMHRVRDFLIKKGGTLLTIAIGAFFGSAIATTLAPAVLGQFVAANPINNIITFGLSGLIAGGTLAYAGIKIKNIVTKLYYKKRYNATEHDLERLEDGLITYKDLRINKLIEKTHRVNAEILRLKQPLPEAKGIGKVKNAIVGFFRKVKRHILNITNRNRIHTISDELEIINTRINNIILSENLTENEKSTRISNLQTIRTAIANLRAKDLLDGIALSVVSKKRIKLENLDIYAKDLLSKKDRKNTKIVRAKAKEIVTSLLNRDITPLAGKYVIGSTIDLYIDADSIDLHNDMTHLLLGAPALQLLAAKEPANTEVAPENENATDTVEEVQETPVNPEDENTATSAEGQEETATTAVEEQEDETTVNGVAEKATIIKKFISKTEKDIAAESVIFALLQDPKVVDAAIQDGCNPDAIYQLINALTKSQYPGTTRNGKRKTKTRIIGTKFFKENADIATVYEYILQYNARPLDLKIQVVTNDNATEGEVEAETGTTTTI